MEEHEQIGAANTPLLNVNEACAQLRVSRWTLYRLIQSGQLATVKIGRRRLVVASDISRVVEKLTVRGDWT